MDSNDDRELSSPLENSILADSGRHEDYSRPRRSHRSTRSHDLHSSPRQRKHRHTPSIPASFRGTSLMNNQPRASGSEGEEKGDTFQRKFASGTIRQGFGGLLHEHERPPATGSSLDELLASVDDDDVESMANAVANVRGARDSTIRMPNRNSITSAAETDETLVKTDSTPSIPLLAISEQARNRSKRTKLYLESRYKHISSVLEKGDVYNPLQVIRNREDDRPLNKIVEAKGDEKVKEERRKRERLRDQLLHSAQQLPGYNALANLVLQGSIYSDSETECRPQSKSIWDVNPEEAVRDYLYQKVKEQENIKDLQQQLRASLSDPNLGNGSSDSPASNVAKIPALRKEDSSGDDSSVSIPDASGYKTPPQVATAPQSSSPTTTASSPQFGGLGFFNRSSKSSISTGKKQKAPSNESGGSSRSPSRSRSSSLSSAKKALGLGGTNGTPLMFPDSRSTPNSPRHQNKSFTAPIMPSVPVTRKVTDFEEGKSNGNLASRPLALSTSGLLRAPELTGIAELSTPQQSPSTSMDVSMAGIGDAFQEKTIFEESIEGFTAGQARGTAEQAANTMDIQSQLAEVKTLRMRYDEDILRVEGLQDDCRTWLNEQMQELVRQDVRLEDASDGGIGESSIEGRLRQLSEQDRYQFEDKLQAVQQRTRLWNTKLRDATDKTKGMERIMDQCTHDMIDLTSEIVMHYGRQAKLVEQDIDILLKEMDVSFLRNTSYITLNWAVSTLLVLIQGIFIVVRFGIAVVSRIVWFIVPFWLVRIGIKVIGWLLIPLLYFLFDVIKVGIKAPWMLAIWPIQRIWRHSSVDKVPNENGHSKVTRNGRGRPLTSQVYA